MIREIIQQSIIFFHKILVNLQNHVNLYHFEYTAEKFHRILFAIFGTYLQLIPRGTVWCIGLYIHCPRIFRAFPFRQIGYQNAISATDRFGSRDRKQSIEEISNDRDEIVSLSCEHTRNIDENPTCIPCGENYENWFNRWWI